MSHQALHRIQESIEADTHLIAQGRLQRSCASFFQPAQGDAPRGVILMLHGWSAGPWQFLPMAGAMSQAGLHCYAARLPGHGACLQDGSEDPSLLPRGAQSALYAEAAEAAYQRAAALALGQNLPLFVFGFSLGGAVALDLVRLHPKQITRLVLAAPMLRPRGMQARLTFRMIRGLGHVGGRRWFDRIPFSWGPRPAPGPNDWVRPGHWTFRMGHLFSAMTYARGVFQTTKKVSVPTQLFISDTDDKSDPETIVRLLRNSKVEYHVWHFAAAQQVPHAMLTPEENPNAESRALIYKSSLDFFLHGRGSSGISS